MATLKEICAYCDQRTKLSEVKDFPGAENGLQLENNGTVTKIGAAVDAGRVPFEQAARQGIDFLIVHHGLYWSAPIPVTGNHYKRLKSAMDANLAVYGSHLPLDAHPEIGNNVLLAQHLGLKTVGQFLPYEGTPIAVLAEGITQRAALKSKLEARFPGGVTAIEYGPSELGPIAILTGSGRSALPHLKAQGTQTLITGELRQEHFNLAQEEGFNLYCCGHYATETYGVKALAAEVAKKFGLPWEFVATDCPL